MLSARRLPYDWREVKSLKIKRILFCFSKIPTVEKCVFLLIVFIFELQERKSTIRTSVGENYRCIATVLIVYYEIIQLKLFLLDTIPPIGKILKLTKFLLHTFSLCVSVLFVFHIKLELRRPNKTRIKVGKFLQEFSLFNFQFSLIFSVIVILHNTLAKLSNSQILSTSSQNPSDVNFFLDVVWWFKAIIIIGGQFFFLCKKIKKTKQNKITGKQQQINNSSKSDTTVNI